MKRKVKRNGKGVTVTSPEIRPEVEGQQSANAQAEAREFFLAHASPRRAPLLIATKSTHNDSAINAEPIGDNAVDEAIGRPDDAEAIGGAAIEGGADDAAIPEDENAETIDEHQEAPLPTPTPSPQAKRTRLTKEEQKAIKDKVIFEKSFERQMAALKKMTAKTDKRTKAPKNLKLPLPRRSYDNDRRNPSKAVLNETTSFGDDGNDEDIDVADDAPPQPLVEKAVTDARPKTKEAGRAVGKGQGQTAAAASNTKKLPVALRTMPDDICGKRIKEQQSKRQIVSTITVDDINGMTVDELGDGTNVLKYDEEPGIVMTPPDDTEEAAQEAANREYELFDASATVVEQDKHIARVFHKYCSVIVEYYEAKQPRPFEYSKPVSTNAKVCKTMLQLIDRQPQPVYTAASKAAAYMAPILASRMGDYDGVPESKQERQLKMVHSVMCLFYKRITLMRSVSKKKKSGRFEKPRTSSAGDASTEDSDTSVNPDLAQCSSRK